MITEQQAPQPNNTTTVLSAKVCEPAEHVGRAGCISTPSASVFSRCVCLVVSARCQMLTGRKTTSRNLSAVCGWRNLHPGRWQVEWWNGFVAPLWAPLCVCFFLSLSCQKQCVLLIAPGAVHISRQRFEWASMLLLDYIKLLGEKRSEQNPTLGRALLKASVRWNARLPTSTEMILIPSVN